MDKFAPLNDNKMTNKDRSDELASLILLTEKRDGIIKGRTCDNGRKQQLYIKQGGDVSPIVSLVAIMITTVIEIHEGRDMVLEELRTKTFQEGVKEHNS